jgi:nanoRNase/pAp phosphatase (c-di-AMP/oligoRNAs hydrolase)
MKCFFHKIDLDGKCSGAIVKHDFSAAKCIPFEYSDAFPWDQIEEGEDVFLVDVSLKPPDMDRLNQMCKLVWIDHHKTAIEATDSKIKGLRKVGKAGCELTWEYLHQEDMPYAIILLGRYDVWDKSDKELWDNKILPFQSGMKAFNTSPDNQSFWSRVFDNNDIVQKIIEKGVDILGYQRELHKSIMERQSFDGMFDGHKAIFCNVAGASSQLFDKFYDPAKHDLMVAYSMNKNRTWNVSLYSDKIDVSQLAKKHGGGGHAGAAGFVAKDLSFIDT